MLDVPAILELYRNIEKLSLQDAQKLEMARRAIAKKGRESLGFFVKHIIRNPFYYDPLHNEVCDWWQRDEEQLILLPRGHMKTAICTIADSLWTLAKYPNSRLLLVNRSLDKPKSWLKEIRDYLVGAGDKEFFRFVYPEMCPAPEDVKDFGKTDELTIPSRSYFLREPSISVDSIEAGKSTGKHFSKIYCDDLVDIDNNTPTGHQKVEDFIANAVPLLEKVQDPGGNPPCMKYIATRWAHDDPYRTLMERGVAYKKKAIIEDGKIIFPLRFPPEVVKGMISGPTAVRSDVWSHQYMNRPQDLKDIPFKREFAQFFEDADIADKKLKIALTLDIATPDPDNPAKACATAFTVTGIDNTGRVYVLEIFEKVGMHPTEVIEKITELYHKWKCYKVFMETISFQQLYSLALYDYQKKSGDHFPVHEIRGYKKGESKDNRILAMEPMYRRKELYFRRSQEALLNQLWSYPKSQRRDLIDALSMRWLQQVWADKDSTVQQVEPGTYAYYQEMGKRQLTRSKSHRAIGSRHYRKS